MVKISPVKRTTLNQILKKKNLLKNQGKTAPTVAINKQGQQTIESPVVKTETDDAYVRELAKNILKDMPKYELNVITKSENYPYTPLESMASENSIWAPWSKMFKAKK